VSAYTECALVCELTTYVHIFVQVYGFSWVVLAVLIILFKVKNMHCVLTSFKYTW